MPGVAPSTWHAPPPSDFSSPGRGEQEAAHRSTEARSYWPCCYCASSPRRWPCDRTYAVLMRLANALPLYSLRTVQLPHVTVREFLSLTCLEKMYIYIYIYICTCYNRLVETPNIHIKMIKMSRSNLSTFHTALMNPALLNLI